MKAKIISICLVLLLNTIFSAHVLGQDTIKIYSTEIQPHAYFGQQMMMTEEYLAISSWNISAYDGDGMISIYKLDNSNYLEKQSIVFDDTLGVSFVSHHGRSLDMHYDRLIAGSEFAYSGNIETGFACVYKRNGEVYSMEGVLVPPDGQEDDHFGQQVSIHGGYAVVGASHTTDSGPYTGSAYVFHFNGTQWEFQQKLMANDAEAYSLFGSDVSIYENMIVVGSKHLDNKKGAVYVYEKSEEEIWTQIQKIVPVDSQNDDEFGANVILDNNLLICLATGKGNLMNYHQGAVYTYTIQSNTWIQKSKINCPDTVYGTDEYPGAIKFYDSKLAISDIGNTEVNPGAGAIYTFDILDGTPLNYEKVLPPDTFTFAQDFARSFTLSLDNLIVGCPEDMSGGLNSGSALAYLNIWTSTPEVTQNRNVEFCLFPNPAKNKIQILCSDLRTQKGFVEIISLNGKEILAKKIEKGNENINIDLHNLQTGLYLCKITINKRSSIKKIIIE